MNQSESAADTNHQQVKNILSFDGGGSRGILELSILSDVMRLATILLEEPEKLSYLTDDQDEDNFLKNPKERQKLVSDLLSVAQPIHPTDIYDMIVGTSTGGLITFGLVGGKSDEDGKRLPMSPEECIDMYLKNTKNIFQKSVLQQFLSKVPGLRDIPLIAYPKNNVKQVLLEYFNDSSLVDFEEDKTVAGVVARQIGQREKLVLFDTRHDSYKLYKVYQVLQATSNAPVYFDTPVTIGDKQFVDGGVGGNCPLAQAIPRAKELFRNKFKIATALSIAPPPPKECHVPRGFQVNYWLKYFVNQSTDGYAVYDDVKRQNPTIEFRRLSPRGEKLKDFKLDEADGEKMLQAINEEKISNEMFLVDIVAIATFVVDTYLGKSGENGDRSNKTIKIAAKLAHLAGRKYASIPSEPPHLAKRNHARCTSEPDHELAFDSLNTSLRLWQRIQDMDTTSIVAEIYSNMAECLENQGKLQQAIKFYQDSVDLWQESSDESARAETLFNMAGCLLSSYNFEEAESKLELLLNMQQKIHGEGQANKDVACTLNKLGWCNREQGEFKKANDFYSDALEIRTKLYQNEDHLDIAESLNSLALCLSDLGNNDEAIKYAKKSLKMRENLFHEKNGQCAVAESHNNLGWCLMENKVYNEAHTHFEKALEMKKFIYGHSNQVSIAITMENFAKCLLHENQIDPAHAYVQQALDMKKTCLGDVNNAGIAKTLEIAGSCCEKAQDFTKAMKYYKASQRMRKHVLWFEDHPDLKKISSKIEQCQLLMKKAKIETKPRHPLYEKWRK